MAISLEDVKSGVTHLIDRMNSIIADDTTIDIDKCIEKAISDLGTGIANIDPETKLSLALNLRVLYYAVMEARLTVMFDYRMNSGNEGREIDKTKRTTQLKQTMDMLDSDYRRVLRSSSTSGGTWTMSERTSENLDDYE